MFKTLQIENFRCLRNIKVKELSRLNVITGGNAAGKTTLLEALFLCSGNNPELVMRIQAFRGAPGIEVSTSTPGYKALWRDLFSGFDDSQSIYISLGVGETVNRSLRISYEPSQGRLLRSAPGDARSAPGNASTESTPVPINFTWTLSSGKSDSVVPEIVNNILRFPTAASVDVLPGVYLSAAKLPSADDIAAWYSELSISNAERPFVQLVKSIFPFVEDLSLQHVVGKSVIHAAVTGLPHKIPATLVSMGMVKLLGILLGISKMKGGIVLIDEIESGFHHSILKPVWKLIEASARQNDVQVFATTHSGECIDAAVNALEDPRTALCFLKLVRTNAETAVRVFNGVAVRSAIEEEVEVR